MFTQTTQNNSKAVSKKEPLAGQPDLDIPLPLLPIFQQLRPIAQASQTNTLAKSSLQQGCLTRKMFFSD